MAWSEQQIKFAVEVAVRVGMTEEDRKFLLGRMPHAFYSKFHDPRKVPTSKSPRLNDDDFHFYLAEAEVRAGGKLPRWGPRHWQAKREESIARLRAEVVRLNSLLVGRCMSSTTLADWIRDRTNGRTEKLEECGLIELQRLVEGHVGLAQSQGTEIEDETPQGHP